MGEILKAFEKINFNRIDDEYALFEAAYIAGQTSIRERNEIIRKLNETLTASEDRLNIELDNSLREIADLKDLLREAVKELSFRAGYIGVSALIQKITAALKGEIK